MLDNLRGIGVSPEMKVLLCCAGPQPAAETRDLLISLLRKGINWAHLLLLADRHRTTPLLYRGLTASCPDAIPPAVLSQLRNYYHSNARRNIFLTEELCELLALFESHHIAAVPFKGPTLAATAYGSLALRQGGDLDILLHHQDYHAAKALLGSRGYTPLLVMGGGEEASYIKKEHAFTFVRNDRLVELDIHWRITHSQLHFPINVERLLDSRQVVVLAGRRLVVLTAEDLFLILCVHSSKHYWERLVWVSDLAFLIGAEVGINWAVVMEQARRLGCKRMLLLGLILVDRLLNMAVPAVFRDWLRIDRELEPLSELILRRFLSEPRPALGYVDKVTLDLNLRERLRDRLRYCRELPFFTISPDDRNYLPWQTSFSFLHRLVRPVRVMRKYGLSSFRRPLTRFLGLPIKLDPDENAP